MAIAGRTNRRRSRVRFFASQLRGTRAYWGKLEIGVTVLRFGSCFDQCAELKNCRFIQPLDRQLL